MRWVKAEGRIERQPNGVWNYFLKKSCQWKKLNNFWTKVQVRFLKKKEGICMFKKKQNKQAKLLYQWWIKVRRYSNELVIKRNWTFVKIAYWWTSRLNKSVWSKTIQIIFNWIFTILSLINSQFWALSFLQIRFIFYGVPSLLNSSLCPI